MTTKELIRNSEQRCSSYDKMLEDVNRDKISFPKEDVFVHEYKYLLRENKNKEKMWLKMLVNERTNENEGLNPDYCYPY